MSCICFEGYTGNGVVSCDKISKQKQYFFFFLKQTSSNFSNLAAPIEIGCASDDECAFSQACRNRACMNPCSNDNPCAPTAECTVNNHRAICKCPPGFTGDAYSRCVPSKIIRIFSLANSI